MHRDPHIAHALHDEREQRPGQRVAHVEHEQDDEDTEQATLAGQPAKVMDNNGERIAPARLFAHVRLHLLDRHPEQDAADGIDDAGDHEGHAKSHRRRQEATGQPPHELGAEHRALHQTHRVAYLVAGRPGFRQRQRRRGRAAESALHEAHDDELPDVLGDGVEENDHRGRDVGAHQHLLAAPAVGQRPPDGGEGEHRPAQDGVEHAGPERHGAALQADVLLEEEGHEGENQVGAGDGDEDDDGDNPGVAPPVGDAVDAIGGG